MRSTRLALFLVLALAAPASADVLRILDDDGEAAQVRVDLMQQATGAIHSVYFMARNDLVTLSTLALLRDARRRGVPDVRLIVDATFHHIPKPVLAYLADEGVEVRIYHPFTLLHLGWIFRRMHDKAVIVDGRRYITGGRNLADSYFGLEKKKKNYVDRDVYVDGESATDADRHFVALWNSAHVADHDSSASAESKQKAGQRLDDALRDAICSGFITVDSGRDWSAGRSEVASTRFLHDPISDADGPRLAMRLAELIDEAKTSIVIESPYLIPSRPMLELLEKKGREGLSIVIVTNSLLSTDGVLPYVGYLKYRRRVIRAGIEIREYKGPGVLHAKSAVIDGRVLLIGSFNLDHRSQNLNSEVMCVAVDEDVARELRDSIETHILNSWTIHTGAHPPRNERPPRIRRFDRLKMLAIRMILPLIEGQL
jgi:putative cardiolipin synthase